MFDPLLAAQIADNPDTTKTINQIIDGLSEDQYKAVKHTMPLLLDASYVEEIARASGEKSWFA